MRVGPQYAAFSSWETPDLAGARSLSKEVDERPDSENATSSTVRSAARRRQPRIAISVGSVFRAFRPLPQ